MEKQEMSKRIQVYLPAELASRVEQLAKAEHMTVSSCCTVMIGDAIQELIENNLTTENADDEGSEETVHIHLYGKEASLLKRKANELQLTPTEWVRNTVLRKDLTIHRIRLDDLEELLDLYGRNVAAIEGIVTVCRENNNALKQDVELIRELMETVHDQLQIQLLATLGKRKKEKQKRVQKGQE
jgi:predicted transcriptional regulator